MTAMTLARIRELRQQKGLTLNQLASLTGMSVGMISQVERGITDPSLETLRRISDAFGVPLFDLFREDQPEPVTVIRKDARRQVSSPQGQIVWSQVSRTGGKLEVLEAAIKPGAASSSERRSHASEECVLVLSGRLRVEVGKDAYDLEAGDSCHFASTIPHRFVNPHRAVARYIVAVTPPSA
jgi:transcriptional regulator with XRE-family HTH domain